MLTNKETNFVFKAKDRIKSKQLGIFFRTPNIIE